MARARSRSWLFLVAFLALMAARPAVAISPALLMFYGGPLKEPVVIRLHTFNSGFIWDSIFRPPGLDPGGRREVRDLAPSLSDRPFMSVAIFWGRYDEAKVKPADASQHGRLYLPTASQPAVMVATLPDMQEVPHPIPARLDGFAAVWTLTPQDLRDAKSLGIPGFK